MRELIEVHNATMEEASRLSCIAEVSTGFDTRFYEENSYGIFNISCALKETYENCNIPCSAFSDDNIEDDFLCAQESYEFCDNNSELSVENCTNENIENNSTSTRISSVILENEEEKLINYTNTNETGEEFEISPAVHSSEDEFLHKAEVIEAKTLEIEARSSYDDSWEKLQLIQYLLSFHSRANVRYIFLFV